MIMSRLYLTIGTFFCNDESEYSDILLIFATEHTILRGIDSYIIYGNRRTSQEEFLIVDMKLQSSPLIRACLLQAVRFAGT